MKGITLLTTLLIFLPGISFSQEIEKSETPQKGCIVSPFIGAGFLPMPTCAILSLGTNIGDADGKSPVYGSIYSKFGNLMMENTYHSYYLELKFRLKRFDFRNNSSLVLETPIWIGSRNSIETFTEEHHEKHDNTYVQAGVNFEMRYQFLQKLSLVGRAGVGYGPKYSYAGDFQFDHYQFESYAALPLVDLSIVYHFLR